MLPTFDVQVNVRVTTSHFLSACRGHALSPVGTEPHRRRENHHSGRFLIKETNAYLINFGRTPAKPRERSMTSSNLLCMRSTLLTSSSALERVRCEIFYVKNLSKGGVSWVTIVFTQGREKDAKITIYKKTEDTYVS